MKCFRDDAAYRRLAAAVVLQAVEDWRLLCQLLEEDRILISGPAHTEYKGAKKPKRIPASFTEIRNFLTTSADFYVGLDPADLIEKLNREMRLAITRRERKKNDEDNDGIIGKK